VLVRRCKKKTAEELVFFLFRDADLLKGIRRITQPGDRKREVQATGEEPWQESEGITFNGHPSSEVGSIIGEKKKKELFTRGTWLPPDARRNNRCLK